MVTDSTNEEGVAPCNGEPNVQRHEWHHLAIRTMSIVAQIGWHLLLHHFGLSHYHAINRVDYWLKALCNLGQYMRYLFFSPVPDPQKPSSGPCADRHGHPYQLCGSRKFTDNHTPESHGCQHLHASRQSLLTLATLLCLLLLLYLLLHHQSCWVCWGVCWRLLSFR